MGADPKTVSTAILGARAAHTALRARTMHVLIAFRIWCSQCV